MHGIGNDFPIIDESKGEVIPESDKASSRYKDHEALAEECRTIFPNTDIAREGETFYIEQLR